MNKIKEIELIKYKNNIKNIINDDKKFTEIKDILINNYLSFIINGFGTNHYNIVIQEFNLEKYGYNKYEIH